MDKDEYLEFVRERKTTLEKEITKLVTQFEIETGLSIYTLGQVDREFYITDEPRLHIPVSINI